MENTYDLSSVYFIGIGGVSMSSLAMILHEKGSHVSGYDMNKSENTEKLEENGIYVDYSYRKGCLDGITTVVFSAAIKESDPIYSEAVKTGIQIIPRAELLGIITSMYEYSVGVAGTHGKSTTTGMIAEIFLKLEEQCAVLSGAYLPSIRSLYKSGNGKRVVFEACEYKDSFLYMKPNVKVVTNCKHDHVDYFPKIENVIESFKKYIDADNGSGRNVAVINADCENAVRAATGTRADVKYYSIEKKTDLYAENIKTVGGKYNYDIVFPDGDRINVSPRVIGIHNVSNSLAAALAAYLCGADKETIKSALESFAGVSRRFEYLGEYDGISIFDDYAHHPDEIEATLNSANALGYNKTICVFQPHTYSRTKELLSDFAKQLSLADKVFLCEIYPAREENIYGISSKDLARLIPNAEFCSSFEEAAQKVIDFAKRGDAVITMGAGEAYKTANILLGK